ncbi:amino acid adenylation domain-containing protein [Rothia santali]|uniref:amino acid adenylation domain-containing protein n=1 Tax=Rothia santali TaxID=2949643 RepID=UPI002666A7E3|nr:amino acid adenylation domain-containing protein [Rothia santali]
MGRPRAHLREAATDGPRGRPPAPGGGAAPGGVVALRVERGIEQYQLLHALLYAGAAYLPVDPELPAARVAAMLEDAGCRLLVDGPGIAPLGGDGPVVEIAAEDVLARQAATGQTAAGQDPADDAPVPDDTAQGLPGHRTGLADVAYVQFTSGSTGRPKGVPITHAALDNRLRWQQHLAPVGPGDRVAHKTAISFDVHVWELYWPLQEGATVVIAAPGGHRDPEYLARLLAEERVTCLHFVPTMLSALIASPSARRVLGGGRTALRHLVCSGEALTRDQVRGAHDLLGVHPLNLYGPTEAAIDVTSWHTGRDPEAALVPIGTPAWNTGCHVVDPCGRLCPPGVPGELRLSGVQVMSGYLNRPEADATALTRLDLPGREEPLPAYRTGDLAVWREDGVLEYRGRRDHQVKIGGQRLELGEVEAVLADAPGVNAATVMVRTVAGQDVLAAFLELRAQVPHNSPDPQDTRVPQNSQDSPDPQRLQTPQDPQPALDAVRDHAARRLPAYMVPTLWKALDSMPATVNGKADRRALESLDLSAAGGEELPRGLREQLMCELFGDVLGEPAGPETDFFAAGGASLSALELGSRVETRFGRPCSLAAIFAHPTPRGLAEALDDGAAGDLEPALLLRRGTDPSATPIAFLPPAGGLGWCYAALLRHLDPRRTVWALQAPQFTDPSVPWPADLAALAEDYLGLLREVAPGPVTLAGWSVGGMAAAETAARAPGSGVEVERVVLLDAYPPSYWRSRPAPEESDLWVALLRMGGVEPDGVPDGLEETVAALRERGSALATLDDDALRTSVTSVWHAMGYTRGAAPRPLDGHLVHCGAEKTLADGADAALWEAHCGSVDYVRLEGDHVAVLAPANGPRVAEALQSARGEGEIGAP